MVVVVVACIIDYFKRLCTVYSCIITHAMLPKETYKHIGWYNTNFPNCFMVGMLICATLLLTLFACVLTSGVYVILLRGISWVYSRTENWLKDDFYSCLFIFSIDAIYIYTYCRKCYAELKKPNKSSRSPYATFFWKIMLMLPTILTLFGYFHILTYQEFVTKLLKS